MPWAVICCDRPGCTTHVPGHGGTELAAVRAATVDAGRQGWQFSKLDAEHRVDLCPDHAEPTLPIAVTRLYDEQGRALVRGSRS